MAPHFSCTAVFDSPVVRIGAFRCDAAHAAFHHSEPIARSCIWFPRTPLIVQPERERPFVANPVSATFYNRSEVFGRASVGGHGDASDWFAVEESVVEGILSTLGPASHRRPGPFGRFNAPIDASTYLLQRRLFSHVTSGRRVDELAVEEMTMQLYERAIVAAERRGPTALPAGTDRARDLAHDVEAILSADLGQKLSLADISKQVGVSVYHLCRQFRRASGCSIHQYRTRLRLRTALAAVVENRGTLTSIAASLGFPSHSHFTSAFRREFGMTPSQLRRLGK